MRILNLVNSAIDPMKWQCKVPFVQKVTPVTVYKAKLQLQFQVDKQFTDGLFLLLWTIVSEKWCFDCWMISV